MTDCLYWAKEAEIDGRMGILVRYPMKGIALEMAERLATEKGHELLEQYPRGRHAEDGAMQWFFEYSPE